MEIRDGHNGLNPHFFFLFPIRPFNVQPPKSAPFNPDLAPVVDICEWSGSACVQQIAHLTMGTQGLLDRVFVLPQFEEYIVLWRTDQLHLSLDKTYRISVLVGTRVLGFADVDVVRTLREAAKVDRDDFVPLLNNLILPIPFRIEQGALCDGATCNSKSIDLSRGGSVVFEQTGDRVDIPAQSSNQAVTVTVHLCDGITADLPKFGNCLTVTADPRLAAPLSPKAVISMCSLGNELPGIIHAQQDLITLHRQDAELITALPHSPDFCPRPIGAARPPRNWLAAAWRMVRRNVGAVLGFRELHAATALMDVGGGGETPAFSDFQFLLPSKMDFGSVVDQITNPNSAVASAPSVLVTDAEGRPVGNARVHFRIVSEGGTIAPADGVVLSDPSTGRATLTEWRLGPPGGYSVQAYGRGIADPRNNGPDEGFDPFAPAVLHDPQRDRAQPEVSVGTGSLTFTATATAPVTVPDAPTNVSALRGDGLASVSWEAPANNGGAPITSYTMTANPGGATATTPFGSPASFQGLTNGTSYTFTVVATNSAGSGPASSPSNAVTPAGVPTRVTGLTFLPGAAGGLLSWDNASPNGSAITGYVVEVRNAGVLVQNFTIPSTRVSLHDMPMCDYASGTTACSSGYQLLVAAQNDVGFGPRSVPYAASTIVSFTADGLMTLFERKGCTVCHNGGGLPVVPLNLVGPIPVVYSNVLALPDGAVYEKPSGNPLFPHAGGVVFDRTSFEFDVLSRWVRDGKSF